MNSWKKSDKIILILAILLLPSMFLFGEIMMMWSDTSCARIMYLDSVKGSTYVVYKFSINGEERINHTSIQYFKYRDINKLKEKPCFTIKYSTILPSYTRIIDKDIGND